VGSRVRNEDYAALSSATDGQWTRAGIVAAIADGVGGAKGGRVAAEVTVRSFIDGYYGLSPLHGVRRNAGVTLEAVNRWVNTLGRTDAALDGMACTFTALVLRGRQAHVVHVGDTRLYRFREDALVQLTTDHTPGRPGTSSMLTRAIGISDSVRIDYSVGQARVHDRYLLCSDGVHGSLSDGRIRDVLGRRAASEDTARLLVEAALDVRLGDNATALVVDVLDLPPANKTDLEAAIAQQRIIAPPKAGAAVDGFALEAMLSDGQYSRVFRATDTCGQRRVIVKFPKPVTGADALLRQAFLREAWIAARVKSPYVAEVIDVAPGRQTCLYAVMPYYEGETLEARLGRKPVLSLAEGLSLAVMLAKAVASLHRAGIVHRDIKPDNVVLVRPDGLKLLDLGVARLPNMEEFPEGTTPGTASYMAPEMFAGNPGDQLSDLFALGVTVFRMFTNSYPYGEIEPFTRPRFGRPASLLDKRPDLPAWLDQALARAIAPAPEDRFEDVIEFLFAVEHGAMGAVAAPPRRQPVYDRNPLRFWKTVAALLALLLLASVGLR
jgi:serine/threonine protein phosphatase PrpC